MYFPFFIFNIFDVEDFFLGQFSYASLHQGFGAKIPQVPLFFSLYPTPPPLFALIIPF